MKIKDLFSRNPEIRFENVPQFKYELEGLLDRKLEAISMKEWMKMKDFISVDNVRGSESEFTTWLHTPTLDEYILYSSEFITTAFKIL